MDEAALGAGSGGVWTAGQARAAGLSRDQVRHRVVSGAWQVLHRGVYATGGVVADARMRGWAAVLAAGGPARACAAGRTAARLLGLPLVDDADPLLPAPLRTAHHDDVASDRPGRAAGDLHVVRLHLVPGDRVRLGGLPCLSPLRTCVDLARLLPPAALVCVLDDALRRRLVTEDELRAAVEARAGWRHVRVLRDAVASADGRAETPFESLTRVLLLPVAPGLVPQVRVVDAAARPVARLDLADEALRLGVEADGARWHSGQAALAADRRREAHLRRHGWWLERVTWYDVRRDGARTQQRVAAAVRALTDRRAAG